MQRQGSEVDTAMVSAQMAEFWPLAFTQWPETAPLLLSTFISSTDNQGC